MLLKITEDEFDIALDVRYATTDNFTQTVVYQKPYCFIRNECRGPLEKAIAFAKHQGYRLKIFDCFRPQSAQEILWNFCPDPTYIMPPTKGSVHTRGVAIDLTLINTDGRELDMGTPFDDFTIASHHDAILTPEQNLNRHVMLGIMSAAGWDFYSKEWWHYQLFDSRQYDLIFDDHGMM
jgi:zinc D-Ala-D-Ala dipeptidase